WGVGVGDMKRDLPQTGAADFVLVEAGEYSSKQRTEQVITEYLSTLRHQKFLSPGSTRIAVIASRTVDFAGRDPGIVAPSGVKDAVTSAESIAIKDDPDGKDADVARSKEALKIKDRSPWSRLWNAVPG